MRDRDDFDATNHEPETLDSGDQMPAEPNLWGDRRGRHTRFDEPRRERWLTALMRRLRGEPPGGPSMAP